MKRGGGQITCNARYVNLPGTVYCLPSNVDTNWPSIWHLIGQFSEQRHFPPSHKLETGLMKRFYIISIHYSQKNPHKYKSLYLGPYHVWHLVLRFCPGPASEHTGAVWHIHTVEAIQVIIKHFAYAHVQESLKMWQTNKQQQEQNTSMIYTLGKFWQGSPSGQTQELVISWLEKWGFGLEQVGTNAAPSSS